MKIKHKNRKVEHIASFLCNSEKKEREKSVLVSNSSVLEGRLDSRGEQPAGLLGQPQTGQQADDQVHDEEQQVGEPPAETDGDEKSKF